MWLLDRLLRVVSQNLLIYPNLLHLGGTIKDKRVVSYIKMEKLCKKLSVLIQQNFSIPDTDMQKLKRCFLSTFYMRPKFKLA
jgi:hypothetical protein